VIFSIAQATGNSADENYRLVHWGMDEGLSSDDRNIMLKDVHGFLWVGSANGLNRFDGNTFKHYFPEKNKPGAICGAFILNLVEDSLHNIWIGTNKGLARYDSKADTFKNFSPEVNAPLKLIEPFCATKDKLYCMEGGYLLTVYDIHSFQKRIIQKLYPGYSADDNDMAHSFFDAASNSVWMSEHFIPGKSVGGLYQYSIGSGKKNRYTWQCYKNIPGHLHDIHDICFDKKRNVIWVSSTDGLLEFTMSDKQFHRVDALNEVQDSKEFGRESAEGVTLDAKGNVWWCSWPVGPVIFDPSSQSFYAVFSDVKKRAKIAYTNLFIYCDRDGMVWTGCSEQNRGVYQIIPASLPVVHYTTDTSRFSLRGTFGLLVVNGGQEKLWVTQFDDIYTFDPQTGYFHWLSFGKYLPIFKGHLINFLQIDSVHQKALFDVWNREKSEDSLYEMDLASMRCHPVIFKDTLNRTVSAPKQFNVRAFKNNAVLFSDISNGNFGLLTVNIDSCIARWTNVSFAMTSGYATDNDRLIFFKDHASDNRITFSCLHGQWRKIVSPLDTIKWSSVFYNKKDETWWVALNNELRHYNKSFGMIRSYYVGEMFFGDAINEISPDEKGNIWMMFSRSVSWLNTKTGKVNELSEREGFIKRPLYGSLMAGNSLYIWGIGGLDRINPDKIKENYPPSFAYFKSLQVNEKPFLLPDDINSTQTLSLRYNQNRISIETGIIDYYTKGNNSIRYKLDGVNNQWQIAPANYVIRYEQLPPASYKLVMQASNAAGEFNGPEKSLLINISPAFWNTWWFRLLVIVIASYIIVTIVKGRIQKIRSDAFIQNQLRELEMKALKAQMNPHFIYNALNSIQALIANDKKTESIHYIGSFSRLLRQVLENSENNIISLDKELETIGLYIQMETLRLDMQLQYTKHIPKEVITEFEKTPPLILQPFVENALWHGLSRKQGKKEIEISVRVKDDWLLCDITDNGVGRTKAQEWKSNSALFHQSKGIEITRKRLTDFNEDDEVSPIEFFDLYDDKKNPCGTHVTVSIKRKSIFTSA
jgi:ligand-binding sensor domain-containing protein